MTLKGLPPKESTQKSELLQRKGMPKTSDPLADFKRGGGNSAFERLIDSYGVRLTRYFTARTGNPELAEELTQETLFKVWRGSYGYDPERGNPNGYIYTIANNVWRNHLRQVRRLREIHSSAITQRSDGDDNFNALEIPDRHDFIAELMQREDLAQLQHLTRSLDPDQKEIIDLYLQGNDYKTIARILESPIGTVKSALHRVRASLKEIAADLKITPKAA